MKGTYASGHDQLQKEYTMLSTIMCVAKETNRSYQPECPHFRDTVLLPPYRIIGQMCILRQTLTINFSQQKYEIFNIKIISLESSFKYESNSIILYNIFYIFFN
jgi:hypothetical protein